MSDFIDWNKLQPLSIPGFSRQEEKEGRALVPVPQGITMEQWYQDFILRIFKALEIGSYFPIFRISDGEFSFVLGRRFDGLQFRNKIISMGYHIYNTIKFLSPFYSSGRRGYVETYPFWQLAQLRQQFASEIRSIASQGCLCMNISNSALSKPYRNPFISWLKKVDIILNRDNYYHFYFVYALLLGPLGHELIGGRKIAVFTSDLGGRSQKILTSLNQMGAKDSTFYETSLNHPMKERLNLESLRFKPDLCLIGAGVGAANLLVQLRPLGCLSIDAGFVLDILGDQNLRVRRPYCVPDMLWTRYFTEAITQNHRK